MTAVDDAKDRSVLAVISESLEKGGWRATAVLFLLLTAFYLLTAAGNISETDDVYAFAYRAENFPVDYISDPRLMLYHMAMRLLFLGQGMLGLEFSALSLMRGFSALCAAGSLLLLLRILVTDLKLPAPTALLAAAVLGISYGFWRYAAEAEVYIPAIFLILLVFHGLSRVAEGSAALPSSLLQLTGWGAVAGLAVLLYQPSVVPLFFAFPLLLLTSLGRVFHVGVYGAAGVLVVLGGYLLGFHAFWPDPLSLTTFQAFLSQRAEEFIVPSFSLRTVVVSIIRSAFALSHDLASVNWIFAFDPIVSLIQQAFSNNVIDEEVFLARRAGWLVYLPIVTALALIVILLRLLPVLWRPRLSFLKQRGFLVILLWTLINGAIIGRLNPAGLEAWIMVFPPLILLSAALVIEPCRRRGQAVWVGAFAVVLFLHNAVGGMGLVWSADNEYERVKGAWVISEARPEDLVIVTGNAGLVESLRYLSPARVAFIGDFQAPVVSGRLLDGEIDSLLTQTKGRDFRGVRLSKMIQETWQAGGRLIFFDEFFELPKGFKPDDWPEFGITLLLQERLEIVYISPDAGATFLLAAPLEPGNPGSGSEQ